MLVDESIEDIIDRNMHLVWRVWVVEEDSKMTWYGTIKHFEKLVPQDWDYTHGKPLPSISGKVWE